MSLLIVRAYLELAILLAVGLGFVTGAHALASRVARRQPALPWLRLGQALLAASLVLPPLARALVGPDVLFTAPVQVWSGETHTPYALTLTGFAPSRPARDSAPTPLLGEGPLTVVAAALLAASALGLGRLGRDGWRLRNLCRSAVTIRERGRLRVCVSEQAAVPFSAWTGLRAVVVLPARFVVAREHWRIALAHELAHVRARDLAWAHATAVLRALLPWHPAVHLWARWLGRLEELACDDRVLRRHRFSPRAYGECLLWAAVTAPVPARPIGLAVPMLDRSRTFLERRIVMLLDPPARARRPWMPLVALAALTALGVTAALARGAIADRRLGAAEVQEIADDLARTTGFVVTADASVVAEVNRIVSRPETRAKFRAGLARLAAYRTTGEEALRRRGLPLELLAIAQTESRVEALPEAMNRMRSAGIWQFIPSTARRYGLRVDETIDERMDPVRSAEAASALLANLHDDLHDWRLAIAAYNAGAESVRKAIATHGTADAIALAKSGALSRYASAVLASTLLIHRPDLLD